MDDLLSDLGGDKNALNTLEKLENAEEQAQQDLAALLERMQRCKERDAQLEQAHQNIMSGVQDVVTEEGDRIQLAKTSTILEGNNPGITYNHQYLGSGYEKSASDLFRILNSVATEKAEEVRNIIGAWSNEPDKLEKNEANTDLLNLVRQSQVLKDISKYLGRFREIFAQGKRNAYAYGRGEKYSLELGNNISRALTSELAMLASPKTVPLFLQKYQRKQIKQYQRREPIYKGMGDIICCLDESISTQGDPAAWGKAVALTLLEIAADSGRSFALIHFSGPGSFKVDVFQPGEYSMDDKLRAAETFLNGGTDFQTPMEEALRLVKEEGFENADVVFVTDGECALSQGYLEQLHQEQTAHLFTVTGVLLDKGSLNMDFSLKKFCQSIYRTSQLLGDDIVRELVSKRV